MFVERKETGELFEVNFIGKSNYLSYIIRNKMAYYDVGLSILVINIGDDDFWEELSGEKPTISSDPPIINEGTIFSIDNKEIFKKANNKWEEL